MHVAVAGGPLVPTAFAGFAGAADGASSAAGVVSTGHRDFDRI